MKRPPVRLAALEPKMADTILPKTLIFFLLGFALALRPAPASRHPERRFALARGICK